MIQSRKETKSCLSQQQIRLPHNAPGVQLTVCARVPLQSDAQHRQTPGKARCNLSHKYTRFLFFTSLPFSFSSPPSPSHFLLSSLRNSQSSGASTSWLCRWAVPDSVIGAQVQRSAQCCCFSQALGHTHTHTVAQPAATRAA